MLTKLALIPEVDEHGIVRSYPFGPRGAGLEKYANLPSDVQWYIDKLWRPRDGGFGILEIAMGASEYWAQNANADIWPEAALNHVPPGWSGDPERDRVLAKSWGWGYPTFYNGHAFAHHRNREPDKRVGDVEFVTYDPHMHWVLIVVSIDRHNAEANGGRWVVERVESGRPVSCSMGSRVPFDLTTTTKEMDRYERAKAAYDPRVHKTPAQAVLEEHARRKIDGLSRTRSEYPQEMLYHAGEILPSGIQIGVINDYPSFFDISFVGMPADPTAWSVMKLGATHCQISGAKCAGSCRDGNCRRYTPAGALLSDIVCGPPAEENMLKSADLVRAGSLRKRNAVRKAGDIEKEVRPQMEGRQALRPGSEDEPDIPRDILELMGGMPDLTRALSTPSMMGIVLKPREFQRMILTRMGRKPLADRLEAENCEPPSSSDADPSVRIDDEAFDDGLARTLAPFIPSRSCLGPVMHKRIHITIIQRCEPRSPSKEPEDGEARELQQKVGALYAGYRRALVDNLGRVKYALARRPWIRDHVSGLQNLLSSSGGGVSGTLAPLVDRNTVSYARDAYL